MLLLELVLVGLVKCSIDNVNSFNEAQQFEAEHLRIAFFDASSLQPLSRIIIASSIYPIHSLEKNQISEIEIEKAPSDPCHSKISGSRAFTAARTTIGTVTLKMSSHQPTQVQAAPSPIRESTKKPLPCFR